MTNRVLNYIKRALLGGNYRLYWACVKPNDLEEVKNILRDCYKEGHILVGMPQEHAHSNINQLSVILSESRDMEVKSGVRTSTQSRILNNKMGLYTVVDWAFEPNRGYSDKEIFIFYINKKYRNKGNCSKALLEEVNRLQKGERLYARCKPASDQMEHCLQSAGFKEYLSINFDNTEVFYYEKQ